MTFSEWLKQRRYSEYDFQNDCYNDQSLLNGDMLTEDYDFDIVEAVYQGGFEQGFEYAQRKEETT